MKLNFNDSSLVMTYLQIKLKERYNPNTLVNGNYYTTNVNNYGFAHFIARYLNDMYPPLQAVDKNINPEGVTLDESYSLDKEDVDFESIKSLSDTISIANYFLCNNRGEKLINDLLPNPDNNNRIIINDKSVFQKIYGDDICAIFNVVDSPLLTSYDAISAKDSMGNYILKSDHLPGLLRKIVAYGLMDTINTTAKKDRIYYMEPWQNTKEICEIDDLVLSYLLGKTITPQSSAEEIYYVQKLFYGDYIPETDKGLWASDYGNLTDTIKQYQSLHSNPKASNPLFVTGYFDIYTEATILRDRGEQVYGILGL